VTPVTHCMLTPAENRLSPGITRLRLGPLARSHGDAACCHDDDADEPPLALRHSADCSPHRGGGGGCRSSSAASAVAHTDSRLEFV
jgi:hypothetical protein